MQQKFMETSVKPLKEMTSHNSTALNCFPKEMLVIWRQVGRPLGILSNSLCISFLPNIRKRLLTEMFSMLFFFLIWSNKSSFFSPALVQNWGIKNTDYIGYLIIWHHIKQLKEILNHSSSGTYSQLGCFAGWVYL